MMHTLIYFPEHFEHRKDEILSQLKEVAARTNTLICHIEIRELTVTVRVRVGKVYHLRNQEFKKELLKQVMGTAESKRLFSHCRMMTMPNKNGVVV